MKGQSSIEFLVMVGIALVIAAPFVITAQDSIIGLSIGSENAEFQASIDRVGEKVDSVAESGDKSARTLQFQTPSSIDEVYVEDQALIFERRGAQESNFTQTFPVEVNVEEDVFDSGQGVQDLRIESWNSQVNISESD